MLMDAVADLRAAHWREELDPRNLQASASDAAAQALARTDLIFMLANQLALLDLTTLTQYPPPSAPAPTPPTTEDLESRGILRAFRQHWQYHHVDDHLSRQIVAVSDPNDILSYMVSAGDVSIASENLIVANVYLGVARNWFDLFAWPVSAHLNYLTNADVMDIIACGMTANMINRCAP
jgi:hypothetical protein